MCRPVKTVIDEYDLWKSIKVIVTDTSTVNASLRNGAVPLLQKCFQNKGYKINDIHRFVNIIFWMQL